MRRPKHQPNPIVLMWRPRARTFFLFFFPFSDFSDRVSAPPRPGFSCSSNPGVRLTPAPSGQIRTKALGAETNEWRPCGRQASFGAAACGAEFFVAPTPGLSGLEAARGAGTILLQTSPRQQDSGRYACSSCVYAKLVPLLPSPPFSRGDTWFADSRVQVAGPRLKNSLLLRQQRTGGRPAPQAILRPQRF